MAKLMYQQYTSGGLSSLPSSQQPSTVTYQNERQFKISYNRAYSEVVLHGINQQPVRLYCLVDTGADHIQIHKSIAPYLGINLMTNNSVLTKQIQTASGSATIYEYPNIDMDVEGTLIKNMIIFFGNNQTPILGRITVLTAIDIGFKAKSWLF